jgi:hypothetical protein
MIRRPGIVSSSLPSKPKARQPGRESKKRTLPAAQGNFDPPRFPAFCEVYGALPVPVKELADPKFGLLKRDPRHQALHSKRVVKLRLARVGLHYRTVGVDAPDGVLWCWIGSHSEYDIPVGRRFTC